MRPTLALALLSALTGCASGPLGLHAGYRPGVQAVAPPAEVAGSYLLHAGGARVHVQHVAKGDVVGFAVQPDGRVAAVAPDFVHPLTERAYAWEVVSEVPPTMRERVRRVAGETGSAAVQIVVGVVVLTGLIALRAAFVLASGGGR